MERLLICPYCGMKEFTKLPKYEYFKLNTITCWNCLNKYTEQIINLKNPYTRIHMKITKITFCVRIRVVHCN